MKAIVFERYGPPDVLELRDVEVPTPKDDQVLVRVQAASVNPIDWHRLRGQPLFVRQSEGLRRPANVQLGADLAGTVESVGRAVSGLRRGDEVFGMSIKTLAEYADVSADGVAPKPAHISFEQAAAVPLAALTAVQALRRGGVEAGDSVLVNGSSGGVGTFLVQIAKALAAEVTAVCSTDNLDLVRSLGADDVVDYTKEDFAKRATRHDVVVDTVMNRPHRSLSRATRDGGTIVLVGAAKGWTGGRPMLRLARALIRSRIMGGKTVTFLTERSREDLLFVKELIESGKATSVIDRTYPLAQTADAIRYLEQGHVRGKVVVTTS